MKMNFSQYAKHIGKSCAYVTKLINQGRLKKSMIVDDMTGKIFIDSEIADRLLKGDDSKVHEDINTDPEHVEDQYEDDRILNSSYDEAKRIKLCLEAISEKIKIQKERKLLLPADEVKKEAEKAALILRDRLLLIPAQAASKISGMTSVFDIKNILLKFITDTLEDFSNIQ